MIKNDKFKNCYRDKNLVYYYKFVYKGIIYKESNFSSIVECYIAKERLLSQLKNNDIGYRDYVLKFLDYRKRKLELTSYVNSAYTIMKYIYTAFDNVNIFTLTQEDFDRWRDHIESLNLVKGNTIIRYMKDLFEYIDDYHDIRIKFAKRIFNIKSNFEHKNIHYLEISEIKTLIDNCDDSILKMMIILIVFCGLRNGEVRGLKWKDFDIKNHTIFITRTVSSKVKLGKSVSKKPKTKSSIRLLPLSKYVYDELIKYKNSSINTADDDYIFHSIKNNDSKYPISSNTLKKRLDLLCEKCDISQVDVHELRHTFATLIYHTDCDKKYLSSYLGHSNSDITEQVYIHLNLDDKKHVSDSLDELLSKYKF